MGMFEYVKIKEAIGKVQDSVGNVYDAIKAIPKSSGAMNAGEFKEKAIQLEEEKDITNCVFSVTGKGKLHAAWLAGAAKESPYQYRWGLKVVIDDEVVFDVQKNSGYEGYSDYVETVGFITTNLYSSSDIYYNNGNYAGKLIPFVTPILYGSSGGKKGQAPFFTLASYGANIGSFVNGTGNNSSYGHFGICVIPNKPCTPYVLAGRTSSGISSAGIVAGSIIPEPLMFNKSVKIYASNKPYDNSYGIVRVAYTLEG